MWRNSSGEPDDPNTTPVSEGNYQVSSLRPAGVLHCLADTASQSCWQAGAGMLQAVAHQLAATLQAAPHSLQSALHIFDVGAG